VFFAYPCYSVFCRVSFFLLLLYVYFFVLLMVVASLVCVTLAFLNLFLSPFSFSLAFRIFSVPHYDKIEQFGKILLYHGPDRLGLLHQFVANTWLIVLYVKLIQGCR